jgi:Na+(H+)/acetate symporter ActP
MAKEPKGAASQPAGRLWTLLTFDRLITGPVIHFVYWAGLGVVVIGAFAVIGGVIGMAWRDGGWAIVLAVGVLVVGLLVMIGAALLWRAFCEFYVAILRIADDLSAMRRAAERDGRA